MDAGAALASAARNFSGIARARLLGGALEFYDFVIFVFFAATMGPLFFPPHMPEWMRLVQTFGIFAAGYPRGRWAAW